MIKCGKMRIRGPSGKIRAGPSGKIRRSHRRDPGRQLPAALWIGTTLASATGSIVTKSIGKRNLKPYWLFHVAWYWGLLYWYLDLSNWEK